MNKFIDNVGIPDTLIVDLASKQTRNKSTEVLKIICCMNMKTKAAEKGRRITQNHRTEFDICEVINQMESPRNEIQPSPAKPLGLWIGIQCTDPTSACPRCRPTTRYQKS